MELKNKVELRIQEIEKCCLICDVDTPLGQLYDYSCALQSFLIEKMRIAQESQKPQEQKPIELQEQV